MKKLFQNSFKDKLLRKVHKSIYKPGHYYSAVPDPLEIIRRKDQIYKKDQTPLAIQLNMDGQVNFLQEMAASVASFPYGDNSPANESLRYKKGNNFFGTGDALALFLMMRKFRPSNIIEVGSGYSSSVMMDTNMVFFNNDIRLHFIEPYPDRLFSLMRDSDKDRVKVDTKCVQDIPVEIFSSLNENDILFIDSSHVSKIGSDVNFLFFQVLPALRKGVLVHVHDIHYPFEYPENWVDYGMYWNEAYLLRAFLMYNSGFEILLFNDFIHKNCKARVTGIHPQYDSIAGGSFWLRKL